MYCTSIVGLTVAVGNGQQLEGGTSCRRFLISPPAGASGIACCVATRDLECWIPCALACGWRGDERKLPRRNSTASPEKGRGLWIVEMWHCTVRECSAEQGRQLTNGCSLRKQSPGPPALSESYASVIDQAFFNLRSGYFAIEKMRKTPFNNRFSERLRASLDFARTRLFRRG